MPGVENVGLKRHAEASHARRHAKPSLRRETDIDTVRRIQAQFAKFTETLIVPVTAMEGWAAS